QDDDAGAGGECAGDPAVRLGVVADVEERDVRFRGASEAARPCDLDVEALLELGEQQRAVVGDARARRGQRAVVGDLHASSLSIARSHVTRSASALPARPHARASSSPIASAAATASTVGSTTRPVSRSRTTSRGPPASVVVTTGFSARNASNGTIPKSSSTGA